MKLTKPFYRLPVRFDVARLMDEVAAIPASAWAQHPNDVSGNSSVRLISVDGAENDLVDGVMRATPHLANSPYLRQLLASFGVVWSRSRLLKLAAFAGVPQHADINYHWFSRVRMHVPILTHPDVRFHCADASVHMQRGESWIFDNWRLHRVDNPVNAQRIHLVADTSGSASFWQFVAQGESPDASAQQHRYDPARDAQPLTEQTLLRPVMPPAEVDLLLMDLISELSAPTEGALKDPLARYRALLDAFRRDWRQLYQLFGENAAGLPEYTKLRDSVRVASKDLAVRLTMRTNRVPAHMVLEARILRPMLRVDAVSTAAEDRSVARSLRLQRPVFIIAAPRSGSTLLYETLAASEQLCTVGGEAHWLVESIPELRAGAAGVDSNRLDGSHCTPTIAMRIVNQILDQLKDQRGQSLPADTELRFLEKTPKNALRIPFFNQIFADARFIFLWRDPRENISSIIEAWRSGNWKTYNGLDGFDGPWSLILPPGWRSMNARPLEDIAAFQWESTNRIVMDDFAHLPRDRWVSVNYAELVATPAVAIERLCNFIGIEADVRLRERLAAPLPLSRFTQTRPAKAKWQRNAAMIESVMPAVEPTWQRLRSLH